MFYGDGGSDEDRLAFLDRVFEMGCTFWDTAEVRTRWLCPAEGCTERSMLMWCRDMGIARS